MNYNFSETAFPSKDGIHNIYAEMYIPKNREMRAIVQLAHGMKDYVGRYTALADYLCGEGYALAGHHHLGHGRSAGRSEDLGFFADKGGVDLILRDMHSMNRLLRDRYPGTPIIIMGHSMGSFIARLYAGRYHNGVSGLIIHGTGGPNGLAPLGRAIASLIAGVKGPRHRSKLITDMAFGSYNSKYPKSEGEDAWLTRDTARVADRKDDKYTNFTFTASAYRDLFSMLIDCNKPKWFSEYPKELHTLIMSGDMDPVGNYGKGPDYVYKHLLLAGCSKVSIKTYKGARHELFNEANREEVFRDMVNWLDSVTNTNERHT